MRFTHKYTAAGLVSLFLFLAEILLTLRVILKFFFTAAGGSFFQWAYSVTDPLLQPIRWVYPNPQVTGTGHWLVDFPALFAMAFYAVLASLALGIVGAVGTWSAKNWLEWRAWRRGTAGPARATAPAAAARAGRATTTRRRR